MSEQNYLQIYEQGQIYAKTCCNVNVSVTRRSGTAPPPPLLHPPHGYLLPTTASSLPSSLPPSHTHSVHDNVINIHNNAGGGGSGGGGYLDNAIYNNNNNNNNGAYTHAPSSDTTGSAFYSYANTTWAELRQLTFNLSPPNHDVTLYCDVPGYGGGGGNMTSSYMTSHDFRLQDVNVTMTSQGDYIAAHIGEQYHSTVTVVLLSVVCV